MTPTHHFGTKGFACLYLASMGAGEERDKLAKWAADRWSERAMACKWGELARRRLEIGRAHV